MKQLHYNLLFILYNTTVLEYSMSVISTLFVRMQQQKPVQKSLLRNQLNCHSLIYLVPRTSHLVKVLTYPKNFWMEKFSGALDCK